MTTAAPATAAELATGIRHHDRGEFLAAHHALERAWLAAVGRSRPLLQALVQLSAVGVHLERGRVRPALLLLNRAHAKLTTVVTAGGPVPAGIDAAALLAATTECQRVLDRDPITVPDPRRFVPRFGAPVTPAGEPREARRA